MPFRMVPARDRKLFRLVKKADTVHIVKGRSLYSAGDVAREVFLVRTGFIRLVLPGMERGRPERTVGVALPWEMFGDEAFIRERIRRYRDAGIGVFRIAAMGRDETDRLDTLGRAVEIIREESI